MYAIRSYYEVEEDKAPSEVTEKIAEETVKGTTQTTGTDEDTTVGSEKQTTESSGDSTTESADNKQATGAASKAAAVATNVTNTSVSTSPDMIVITAFDGRLRVLVQNPDYQRAILVKMYSLPRPGDGLHPGPGLARPRTTSPGQGRRTGLV